MINRMASMGRMSDEEFERRNRRNKDIKWEEYEYVKENCELCLEVGAQINAGADLTSRRYRDAFDADHGHHREYVRYRG